MNNPDLLFAVQWARRGTLQWYRDEPVPYALASMSGSTNHLLWQLGHIYVIAENINDALGYERDHEESWWQLFKYGSKPQEVAATEWPNWSMIVGRLEQQAPILEARISSASIQDIASPNPKPAPHRRDTVRGWIVHTIRHEDVHCGIMRQMRTYHRSMSG